MDKQSLNYLLLTLHHASAHILNLIREDGPNSVINISTTHVHKEKWEKALINPSVLKKWTNKIGMKDINAFVLSTNQDTSEHIFYHKKTLGLVTILGKEEGYQDPRSCHFYCNCVKPMPASPGITLRVQPKETIYCFSSPTPKQTISVLCVMSRNTDNDHYIIKKF